MKKEKKVLSNRVKQDYKLINQHYAWLGALFLILVAVFTYMVWHTTHMGRGSEAIACAVLFGMVCMGLFFTGLGRWLEARKKARMQDTLNKMASAPPLINKLNSKVGDCNANKD